MDLLVIDVDATLVTSHSDDKEGAAGTYKHTFGFHPLLAYLDRGSTPGEPLAELLRPGNAAPGTTEDLIELVDLALAQLTIPAQFEPVLVRSDSAGGSSQLAWHLREQQVWLQPRHADRRSCARGGPGPTQARLDPGGRPRRPAPPRRRGVRADRLARPAVPPTCRWPGRAGRYRPRSTRPLGARMLLPKGPGGFNTVHSRHAQVHEDHVGMVRGGLSQGLGAIIRPRPTDRRRPGDDPHPRSAGPGDW
jgi:hypothetical protein